MKPPGRDALLRSLQDRFTRNMHRHPMVTWTEVVARLDASPTALKSLAAMEASGGEPDVIGHEPSGQVIFCDCAPESPTGRRSLCYDAEALHARKENKPGGSAVEAAAAMGAELLTEAQYRALQAVGEFDMKTSSWIATPEDVRARGGAPRRPLLRQGVRVPQRCAILLRGTRRSLPDSRVSGPPRLSAWCAEGRQGGT